MAVLTIFFPILLELLVMRPLGVLILTVYIYLRRKCRKDYEVEVERRLSQSLLESVDEIQHPDPEDPEIRPEETKLDPPPRPKRLPTNLHELKDTRMNSLNKYNIKLLEDIYRAYEDPEEADKVIKVFRKGGIFSVQPIQEEELEYSVD